mmetsp:Transcript_2515/g.5151  ORF Transcript_2515/g.5151 Transcript_2515/m.5151 type:complete len:221 (-) Transcript_2515:1684-2346(-)
MAPLKVHSPAAAPEAVRATSALYTQYGSLFKSKYGLMSSTVSSFITSFPPSSCPNSCKKSRNLLFPTSFCPHGKNDVSKKGTMTFPDEKLSSPALHGSSRMLNKIRITSKMIWMMCTGFLFALISCTSFFWMLAIASLAMSTNGCAFASSFSADCFSAAMRVASATQLALITATASPSLAAAADWICRPSRNSAHSFVALSSFTCSSASTSFIAATSSEP